MPTVSYKDSGSWSINFHVPTDKLSMKQKIMLFTDTGGGSLTRVYSGIEKQLAGEFEFRWVDWRNYSYESFMEVFNWSDICLIGNIDKSTLKQRAFF